MSFLFCGLFDGEKYPYVGISKRDENYGLKEIEAWKTEYSQKFDQRNKKIDEINME